MASSIKTTGNEMPVFNMLRWTSAFLVMAGHAAGWTFNLEPTQLAAHPGLYALRYLLDLGHGAVIVFFVVSGYLVGGSVLSKAGDFNWRNYFAARLARIYVVAIPALLLTAALDGLVYLVASGNPIYAAPWGRITAPVFASYGWQNVLGSLFSLESIAGLLPLGSDKPLWSLGYEWAFYFLFPATLLSVRQVVKDIRLAALVSLGIAALMFAVHARWMASFWVIWIAGALASTIRMPRALGLLGGATAILGFLASALVDQRISDLVEGLGLAIFLAWPPTRALRINVKLDHRLAGLSYSLYLTHMPIFTFAAFSLWQVGAMPLRRFSRESDGWAVWTGICLLALFCAWIFSILFEARTDQVRTWLSRTPAKLSKPNSALAS